ncbi:MAG TPA: hypothetical protein VNM22_14515 [Candidatus Limnocylindrales bacterium]|nr:hypothetical protein [Candidatus Limnocylindrales bacterium]
MQFIFVLLASLNLLAFSITVILGFIAMKSLWLFQYHIGAGLLTALFTCVVHSIVFTHFIGSGLSVKEAVLANNLGFDYIQKTRRFKARVFPFALLSTLLTIVVVAMGSAAHTLLIPGWIHGFFAILAVILNIRAFFLEYRYVGENSRLLESLNRALTEPKISDISSET